MKRMGCFNEIGSYYWLLDCYSKGRINWEQLKRGLDYINKLVGRVSIVIMLLIAIGSNCYAGNVNSLNLAYAINNTNGVDGCNDEYSDSMRITTMQIVDGEKSRFSDLASLVHYLGVNQFSSKYSASWESEVINWYKLINRG